MSLRCASGETSAVARCRARREHVPRGRSRVRRFGIARRETTPRSLQRAGNRRETFRWARESAASRRMGLADSQIDGAFAAHDLACEKELGPDRQDPCRRWSHRPRAPVSRGDRAARRRAIDGSLEAARARAFRRSSVGAHEKPVRRTGARSARRRSCPGGIALANRASGRKRINRRAGGAGPAGWRRDRSPRRARRLRDGNRAGRANRGGARRRGARSIARARARRRRRGRGE